MNIDQARDYLKQYHKAEYSHYIESTLAGDFAVVLAEDHKRMVHQMEFLRTNTRNQKIQRTQKAESPLQSLSIEERMHPKAYGLTKEQWQSLVGMVTAYEYYNEEYLADKFGISVVAVRDICSKMTKL